MNGNNLSSHNSDIQTEVFQIVGKLYTLEISKDLLTGLVYDLVSHEEL